jgi:AAA15 family ATPase/GTPase
MHKQCLAFGFNINRIVKFIFLCHIATIKKLNYPYFYYQTVLGTSMLNSLEIKNFRSLESFQVKRLGQVNLIVGKNNSGKSSVLEALRIFAGSANQPLLEEISQSHDEKYSLNNDSPNAYDKTLPFEDSFSGRQFPSNENNIEIGEINNDSQKLIISHGFLSLKEFIVKDDESGEEITRRRQEIADMSTFDGNYGDLEEVLFVIKGGKRVFTIDFVIVRKYVRRYQGEYPTDIEILPCSVIPTQFISMNELSIEWDSISLTEGEGIVKEALKIVLPEFENLAFVGDTSGSKQRENKRIVKVRLSNLSQPVPLNSLGDGMLRILQLVLKVFSAKNGFLLIDEFENGLHYSVQKQVWELLFKLSKQFNIQIFATTHSWDCIDSFAKVAVSNKDVKGVLFRVGKSIRNSDKGKVISTIFDEDQLCNITQSDVEVR